MKTHISEFPRQPVPHGPQPHEPERQRVQPPTVFVYEKQRWEYKVISRNAADQPPLAEDELNTLGRDGWELVGVATLPSSVQFYLKRVRD
jgi:hypothetical protein